ADIDLAPGLSYRGPLAQIDAEDSPRDHGQEVHALRMVTGAIDWDACADLASAVRVLTDDERAELKRWRERQLERPITFSTPPNPPPQITVTLPAALPSPERCVARLEVFWP